MVRADSAAHAARGRAVLHHSHWIAFALTRIVPDVALGSIGIGANGLLTDATRGGALVVHPLRVLVALTLGGPTWALARFVLAQAFADAACDWTIERHITRVVVAAARRCPALALFLDIFALCGADAARDRAVLVHRKWVLLALAFGCPCLAGFRSICAIESANAARERASLCHELWILGAFAITRPIGAIGAQVVADARIRQWQQGEGEDFANRHGRPNSRIGRAHV